MYASHQMLRVHYDEWLRHAETRRLIKQAAEERSASGARRGRRQVAFWRGLGLRRPVSPA